MLHLIECGQITDAGLKELRNIKHLTMLELFGCQKITDTGLKELKEFKHLTVLNVGRTQITNAGVKELTESLPETEIIQ